MTEPTLSVTTEGFPIHTLRLQYGARVVTVAPVAFRIDPLTGAAEVTLATGDVLIVFPSAPLARLVEGEGNEGDNSVFHGTYSFGMEVSMVMVVPALKGLCCAGTHDIKQTPPYAVLAIEGPEDAYIALCQACAQQMVAAIQVQLHALKDK